MAKQFNNLMRWVVGGSAFVKAYHKVLHNKGAPRVDGVSTKELPSYLLYNWENVKVELLASTYQPHITSRKTGRNQNGDYAHSDNSESKKVGQEDLPTLDSEVEELLVVL